MLWGPAGTGKTWTAVSRLIAIPQTRSSDPAKRRYFISAAKLLHEAKRSFSEDVVSPLDMAMTRGFLVLDDLGAEKPTDWAVEQIGLLLDERWANERETLVTSNGGLEQISRVFGDRVASRIMGFGETLEMAGADRRAENAVEL